MAFERQHWHSGLGLAGQIDRQEPHARGKLGALKDCAGDERGLMTVGIAPKYLNDPAARRVSVRGSAGGAVVLEPNLFGLAAFRGVGFLYKQAKNDASSETQTLICF